MGDPKKQRKQYATPLRPWDRDRIEKEAIHLRTYGLRSKRELWKAGTILRDFRRKARNLLAASGEQADKEADQILGKLRRLGLIDEDSTLVDALGIEIEELLNRRLQSLVYNQGLARTPLQARQMITHGHIVIGDRRVTVPSYIVPVDEEEKIDIHPDSPFKGRIEAEVAKVGKQEGK